MSTACPNCSAGTLGTEVAGVCTECATATVAGASFSLPMLIGGVVAAAVAFVAVRALIRVSGAWLQARKPAIV